MIEFATATADYFLMHAEAMYGCSTHPAYDDALYLLQQFETGKFEDPVPVRAIMQGTKFSTRQRLDRALDLLSTHGVVKVIEVPNERARSSTVVHLHPALTGSALPESTGGGDPPS